MEKSKFVKNIVLALFLISDEIFGRTKIQKFLFLLSKKENIDLEYEIKYYGPFSKLINDAIDRCVKEKLLEESRILTQKGAWGYLYKITDSGKRIANHTHSKIDPKIEKRINKIFDELNSLSTVEVIRYVYSNYPDWNPKNNDIY